MPDRTQSTTTRRPTLRAARLVALTLTCVLAPVAPAASSETMATDSATTTDTGVAQAASARRSGRDWYVAPTGSDSASGHRSAPLSTVDAAIAKAAAGDTIVLRGGVYHQGFTVTKDNLTLRGAPGESAVLDGATPVSGWQQEGAGWVRRGWTPRFDHSPTYTFGAPDGAASGWAFVSPERPMAAWPDQVWLDGQAMRQVASPSQLVPGTFAVDYAAGALHLGSDPTGKRVDASTIAKAASIRGSGTRLQDLTFRRFAPSVPHMGAVTLERPGARLKNVDILDMATTGLSVIADRARLSRVKVLRSGMLGIHASSAYGLRLNRVKVRGNNTEGFNQAPVAGGMKVHRSRDVRIKKSVFAGNAGTGIWFDVSNYDMRVLNSKIKQNTGHGIFLEISDTALIAGNHIRDNRGSGVLVDNTGHVKIWNNTITGTGRPLNIVQDDRLAAELEFPGYDERRPKPDPTVPWITTKVQVRNNVISRPKAVANCMLCVEDYTHRRSAREMGVRADGNVYQRSGPSAPTWVVVWSAGEGDPDVYTGLEPFRAQWGQERHGVLTTSPVVSAAGRATSSLKGLERSVARRLPSGVASQVGVRAGARHLGAWH